MTSIWNFLRYVSIGINGTNNNDQRNGEDLDRIENSSFNVSISNISSSNLSKSDDKELQKKISSPTNIITSLTDVGDNSHIKKLSYLNSSTVEN
jgi:hypothetical protein